MAKKNAAAVALGKLRMKAMTAEEIKAMGRKGGLKGGKKRARALPAEQRKEIARKAAQVRWNQAADRAPKKP